MFGLYNAQSAAAWVRSGQVSFENCDDPPHLSFDGEAYDLVQMHIHSPSEHMVRNRD